MLKANSRRIVEMLDDDAQVLDIGGWAKPFPRADWVLDTLPYETRGLYGAETEDEERFTADTWVCRDICERTPFPFEDDQFDFVVCSHTLEDVRDPVWVCQEISRIGRAGYIEVPSRREEQAYGVQGPWVGWGHHHWLVDIADGRIEFAFKHHVLHGKPTHHFPAGYAAGLTDDERVETLWWEGSFEAGERLFIGDASELDGYLADYVAANIGPMPVVDRSAAARARRLTRRTLRRLTRP